MVAPHVLQVGHAAGATRAARTPDDGDARPTVPHQFKTGGVPNDRLPAAATRGSIAPMELTAEERRLAEDAARKQNWKRWGPYLAERQWGTVREDYSESGDCWNYFPHDHARSRAYRWGEDGLLGITDRECRLCFALALWNERDPILKERLFGLTGPEGNHGEDVKECYYYLDSSPTHSYTKALYKYPQRRFPYTEIRLENERLGRTGPELELADMGAFEDGRYFDVLQEVAKRSPDDLLQHADVVRLGHDRPGQAKCLRARRHQPGARDRVAAREERHIVALPNQLLGQIGDHALGAAVQLWRDALEERRDLCDPKLGNRPL